MEGQTTVLSYRELGLIGFPLAFVGALLLVSMAMYSVKQELLSQKPPSSQSSDEALSGMPPIQTEFRGDLIGYTKDSVALRSIRSENRVALLTLANAEAVLNRGSDFWGNTPEYVKAFDCIGEDPAALLAFRELVLNATPAGRVYGLCGLYLRRSVAFSLAREHLTQSPRSPVWFLSSYDVIERWDVRELAERPEDICQSLEAPSERSPANPGPQADGWRRALRPQKR